MKYSIMGFNQEKLFKDYSKLNCNDIVVLRTLADLISKMEVKIKENNKEYSWVMYKLLVEDLPFITQSESTMKKIVQKLIDVGLIERIIVNRGGKYTYFRKTDKLLELECEVKVQCNINKQEDKNIKKVSDILTEKISKEVINTISRTNIDIVEKAIEACRKKDQVTNNYFIKAIEIASSKANVYKKNNLRFVNFKAREYDYDRLEKKLLGWEKDSDEIEDYRIIE